MKAKIITVMLWLSAMLLAFSGCGGNVDNSAKPTGETTNKITSGSGETESTINKNIDDIPKTVLIGGQEYSTDLTELSITQSFLTNDDIKNLKYMINLTNLSLWNNAISDLSPLSRLTNLTYLHMESNQISDVSPLSNLINLIYLNLENNKISDISPLSNLTNLTKLNISYNNISDISPLSGLTNLKELVLSSNRINDITPLSKLTNLTDLYLYKNNFSQDQLSLIPVLRKKLPDCKVNF